MLSPAVIDSRMIHSRLVCKWRELRCFVRIFVLHQLKFDFNVPWSVLVSITNPQCSHLLPRGIAPDDREPRSCHKVDPLESQSRPQMIESYAFDRAAGHQRLQPVAFHLKNMPAVERHTHVGQCRTNCATFIHHAK